MISFRVTRVERDLIVQIALRAYDLARRAWVDYPVLTAAMDLTAVHANGCPLRLSELATAEGFDFSHDIYGIRAHLNRETGTLEDCFVPRFADSTKEGKTGIC